MPIIRQQVNTDPGAQIAFGRTRAGPIYALGANTTSFSAFAAMPRISTSICTLAITNRRAGRTATPTLTADFTRRATVAAFAAVACVVGQVDTTPVTSSTSRGTRAHATGAALPRGACDATLPAIFAIVEDVDARVATLGEPCSAYTFAFAAAFFGAADVSALAAMRRVEAKTDAITVITDGREVRTIRNTLMTGTVQISAVVAALTTIVVIGAQVHASPPAQASARGASAGSRNALLTIATHDSTITTVGRIVGHVETTALA